MQIELESIPAGYFSRIKMHIELEKRTNEKARARLNLVLCIILAALCVVGLSIGAAPLSVQEVLTGLFDRDSQSALIVRELRLPRLTLAMACGAGLGLSEGRAGRGHAPHLYRDQGGGICPCGPDRVRGRF